MRISDWSSDVCSSDLDLDAVCLERRAEARPHSKNFAVKGDGVVHASATERHVVQLKRRHFPISHVRRCDDDIRYSNKSYRQGLALAYSGKAVLHEALADRHPRARADTEPAQIGRAHV